MNKFISACVIAMVPFAAVAQSANTMSQAQMVALAEEKGVCKGRVVTNVVVTESNTLSVTCGTAKSKVVKSSQGGAGALGGTTGLAIGSILLAVALTVAASRDDSSTPQTTN